MPSESNNPNDDWFHADCPICRQLKANSIEMERHDDSHGDDIFVTVTYSLALQEITGKAMESVMAAKGLPFIHFLLDVFELYPEIQNRYPPGTVGMLINNEPPAEDYVMQSGDTLALQILRPKYRG